MTPPPDRDTLLAHSARCIAALARHDLRGAGFAPGVRLTENGRAIEPGEGFTGALQHLRWVQTLADATSGETSSFAVAEDATGPVLLALRLHRGPAGIDAVEALVNRPGAHPLFAPDALAARPLFERVEPEGRRSSREALAAIAHAYLDGIEQHSGEAVPFAGDCRRIENGVRTTDAPPRFPWGCRSGMRLFTYIPQVRDRRLPVIDPARGLVVAWAMFEMPGGTAEAVVDGERIALPPRMREARSMRLAEVFKVVDGRIAWIEAVVRDEPPGAPTGWP